MKRKHTRNPRVIYPRGTRLLNVKEYVDEIAFEENKDINFDKVSYMSRDKIWWRCKKCNSIYEMAPSNRMMGKGCPYCAGSRVNKTNSMASKYPEVLEHWDWDLNTVLPDEIVAGQSKRRIQLKCPKCKRRYESSSQCWILAKEKCPYCRRHMESILDYERSLAQLYPTLIQEWDFSKNDADPAHMAALSTKEMYWRCYECGKTWKAQIRQRVNGKRRCPNCYPI